MNNQGKTALLKEKIVLKTVLNTITFIIYSLECWKFGFQFFFVNENMFRDWPPKLLEDLHPPTPHPLTTAFAK